MTHDHTWSHLHYEYTWAFPGRNGCRLRVVPVGDQDDRFSLNEMVSKAEFLIRHCEGKGGQHSPDSLGGRAPLGNRFFDLLVIGDPPHQEEALGNATVKQEVAQR